MNIKHIQILSEAETDLEDGRSFYEKQEKGIGDYFWDSLISDIESLVIYSGVHSKLHGFYRMTAKRFPYSVYYSVEEDTAYVVAILPERKNPIWIRRKLKNKS